MRHAICDPEFMQTENVFPTTRKDLNGLKDTALDASQDISKSAADNFAKAKSQIDNLVTHAKSESADHFNQVRGSLNEVARSGLEYVSARPLASLGVVLGVGILLGIAFRSTSRD